eukprot:110742-Pyramimonas_sp.AAC.1
MPRQRAPHPAQSLQTQPAGTSLARLGVVPARPIALAAQRVRRRCDGILQAGVCQAERSHLMCTQPWT